MAHDTTRAGNPWLPGFDPDTAACPDLFADSEALSSPAETNHSDTAFDASASSGDAAARAPWRASPPPAEAARPALWPRISREDLADLGGPVAKFQANLRAISVLRLCGDASSIVTADERRALLRFTGWGGLPQAFNLDGHEAGWRARAVQLESALAAAELQSARASVNNAHYTEPFVIEAMWRAVQGFGFSGGRIIEPAAGTGLFIGAMPPRVASASTLTAVEIDRVSGNVLKALYAPHGVDVRIEPFERSRLADNWFDLAIGNVPFGNFPVADARNRAYSRFSIHAWFIGRALDVVRPGGLVCVIASAYVLDGSDEAVRAYLASQAQLVGAIRLPKGTFSRIASTDVQSDVLFLRKRDDAAIGAEPRWLELQAVPEAVLHPGCRERHLRINRWYCEHPDHLIGAIANVSNGFEAVPTAVFDGDIAGALEAAVDRLPRDVYAPRAEPTPPLPRRGAEATPGDRPGSFRLRNGRVHRVVEQALVDVHDSLNATQRSRIAGMCAIRDAARSVLESQLSDCADHTLALRRGELNAAYDGYVQRWGCLSSRANALAFRRDPDYPLLLSLEHYDDEAGAATKAAIFMRRTLVRVQEPRVASEPEEALAASVQWRGGVDPDYMADLLRAPAEDVLRALAERGAIFHDPASGRWETADAYLSGNVRVKLAQAAAAGQQYRRNASALEKVLPQDLDASAIEARLGAVWIPAHDVEAFLREVLEVQDCEVRYSPQAGAWAVSYPRWEARQSVKVTQEYGTQRINAMELVQYAMNMQVPTVRDYDATLDREVVNRDETLAVREKLALVKERFAAWAFDDVERRERLCRIYNDRFNATRPRRFDGSHLKLPGFSRCFELTADQKNAVWRIVQSGNTGLFHAVGAGKTAICAVASMEMRRLGFSAKPMHVVPNHCLEQYTAEFVRCYPGASVLMASKDDLEGDRRRELVSRIATGDWDAVIITHASFERIRLSPAFTRRFIEQIVGELELGIRAERRNDRGNRIVKQLEAMKKRWQVRLELLLAEGRKDDLLTWEMLGVDSLWIDEAHLHKNLYRFSKMTRVAGLPMTSSERAFDLYLKTRYTMRLHGNAQRGVVLTTATPVANTMAEIHTMMRYLQSNRLEELGLSQFDAWAATFGESVTALEIAPDGSGYRMHTRFARFTNVPELMALWGEVADIRTAEMLKLPVPAIAGGKPRVVICPASDALKAFVQTLVERSKQVRAGNVKPSDDNMLSITTDGRKAALDFRLVAPQAPFDPKGKVAECVRRVVEIWTRSAAQRGAQLVFCDLSAPKGGQGFSVYDDLKARLVDAGIPEREIAFIHDAGTDAQKAVLFKAVREGGVRVLLGSTARMGIGTNVQTRLCALHDLDAPWRPCDIEQRLGRILRQGNTCSEVEVLRYVTEGSFDSFMWQTLETKARFITQVMSGDKGLRSVEDVALAALTYAEVKALASGNPMVIEKAGVDAEIAKLSTLFSLWRETRWNNEREIPMIELTIEAAERQRGQHEEDAEAARAIDSEQPAVVLHDKKYIGREAVGEALRKVVVLASGERTPAGRRSDRIVGRMGRFEIGVSINGDDPIPNLFLKHRGTFDLKPYQQGPSLVAALLARLADIRELPAAMEERLGNRRRRLEELRRELQRPFEHEERLRGLIARQRELERLLDLDKDQAGTAGFDAGEERIKQAA